MSNFVFDEHSGLARCSFSASIEGDCIVFVADEGSRDVASVSAEIDSGEVTAPFCRIVEPRKGGRISGDSPVPGIQIGNMIARKDGPQYSLRSGGGAESLLYLARRLGPLFGNYHDFKGGFGEIREPVAWWVQGAGVLRLAALLRARIEGRVGNGLLDDEVVFIQAGDFSRLTACGHPDMMLVAAYAKDDPFSEPYEEMLTVDQASRPRVFPVTRGSSQGMDTYVRADYCELWGGSGVPDRIACSSAKQVGTAPAPDFAIQLAKMLKSAKLADPEYWEGARPEEAICSKSIFGYRLQTGSEERTPGTMAPGTLLSELSGDVGISIMFGNDSPGLADGVRLPLYEDLYDALMGLHTWRCSPDLRMGVDSFPFYTCALEHLWASLGRSASASRVSFCGYCGSAILSEKGRKYCSDYHRNLARDGKRKERLRKIDAALRARERGVPFSAMDISQELRGEVPEEQVRARLKELKKVKRGADFHVRSKGGNGRGERFVVEDVD